MKYLFQIILYKLLPWASTKEMKISNGGGPRWGGEREAGGGGGSSPHPAGTGTRAAQGQHTAPAASPVSPTAPAGHAG